MSNKKSLKEKLKIIVKYLYIIALFSAIAGTVTFYYVSNLPSHFEGKSTILLKTLDSEKVSNQTFIEILKTRDLNSKVITNLELPYSAEELINLISIKNINDTNLIEVNVKTDTPKDSKNIIDSLLETFEVYILELYPNYELTIIDSSFISNQIIFDNVNLYTGIATAFGGLIGIWLVLLFGSIEINIKNHEDVKKYLSLNSLGIIPNNDVDGENNKKKINKEKDITIIDRPNSIISESYRMARTNLDFSDLKVINFTSTSAGEGKSEVISNIAASFAMIGKKVIIIDCDLRKPVIHKIFKVNRTLGLSDILLYNRIDDYKSVIQEIKFNDKDSKLDIISAGSKIYNPSEMLNSNRFKSLIYSLKEDYDLILIDCPPVSLMTDAVLVSQIADGTTYIIEYNRINSSAINGSIEQLKNVDTFILGTIITKVDIRKQHKLYGSKYEYYYSNYM